jgi:inhibitor of cysteine peptidase
MNAATTTLTEADSDRTIDVRAGETVRLQLHENATTGYRWAFDEATTELVDAREDPYVRRSHAVGSGGDMQWTLTAKAPGTAQVSLKLWRQWEGDRSVQKRFAVTLRIKP